MAAPPELTILDLTGTYYLNKSLTDTNVVDDVLRLQGVGWFKRKAIGLATITLLARHYKDADDVEHIDIDQVLTGGIPGTTEERTLSWKEREHKDSIFGAVVGKSRRVNVDELDESFLVDGWTADTIEYGVVQSLTRSDTPKSGTTWVANQVWGFEAINGERRYVRHLKFTGPAEEDIQLKLIYDYGGPL